MVELFKALAEETRLRILNLLYERELCVCDVMAVLDISQSKASRHLIALKRAGVAKDRREAQWMHYSLVPGKETLLIEELVVNRLRKDERCIEDLKLLDGWQKEKECRCGQCAS
jgi:ArsR family transcriptional regulator